MTEGGIRLVVEGGAARLVLEAPPNNVMNRAFFERFARLVDGELPALRVRGLVIHGVGRHFSSGADLSEMRAGLHRDAGLWRAHLFEATNHLERWSRLPYPVVAAISGCCLGSALELALACTRRVAAANAVFALPESTFGLLPGCGGTVRLPRLIGAGRAAELILSGRTFGAEEALALGVVDRVTTKERLLPEALRSLET